MKRGPLFWIAVAIAVLAVQVAALMSVRFVVRSHYVPTGAMSPAIHPGDTVLARRAKRARPGDIMTFRHPVQDALYVSRVIAVGGETVDIRDKRLFINGIEMAEPYAHHDDPRVYPNYPALGALRMRDQFGPLRIPPDHYFVLGDNRDASYDSRFWGTVPASMITGRVFFIYGPKGYRRPAPRTPRKK